MNTVLVRMNKSEIANKIATDLMTIRNALSRLKCMNDLQDPKCLMRSCGSGALRKQSHGRRRQLLVQQLGQVVRNLHLHAAQVANGEPRVD